MGRSSIEWLNRPGTLPETWNPVVGCSPVSRGCDNCWAAAWAARLAATGNERYVGLSENGKFRGRVDCDEEVLQQPVHWKKPRTVGVSLMGDLFHEQVPDLFLLRVFVAMAACTSHTFILVTKRPKRAAAILARKPGFKVGEDESRIFQTELASAGIPSDDGRAADQIFAWPLANVWILVSCEDQKTYDQRVKYLEKIHAAVVGVSIEPMLGPIALPTKPGGPGWVIFGAESINGGAGRMCKNPWIASGVLACKSVGVPAFVKQVQIGKRISKKPDVWPRQLRVRQWPKGTTRCP